MKCQSCCQKSQSLVCDRHLCWNAPKCRDVRLSQLWRQFFPWCLTEVWATNRKHDTATAIFLSLSPPASGYSCFLYSPSFACFIFSALFLLRFGSLNTISCLEEQRQKCYTESISALTHVLSHSLDTLVQIRESQKKVCYGNRVQSYCLVETFSD